MRNSGPLLSTLTVAAARTATGTPGSTQGDRQRGVRVLSVRGVLASSMGVQVTGEVTMAGPE